jgi:chromosome segregation ATPase
MQQISQREKIMMRAVATCIVEEERQREAVGRDLESLRGQVKALELELAELRAEAKLHNPLSSIAERLDRLEATASRSAMKVVPARPIADQGAMIA